MLGLCLSTLPGLAQATASAPTVPPACGPLVQLAQVDLVPAPNDGRMLVPVTVNGVTQKLLLGTAGGLITFNQATAQALHLPLHDGSDKRVLDASGFASRRYVQLQDFSVAGATVRDHTFAVTPDPKAGTDPVNDGVYDAGLQYRFDVEMDFANRKLTYFSPNHCPGHVVHWQAEVAGIVPLAIVRRQEDSARHGSIGGAAALINSADTLADSDYFMSLIESAPGIAGSDLRIKVTLDGTDLLRQHRHGAGIFHRRTATRPAPAWMSAPPRPAPSRSKAWWPKTPTTRTRRQDRNRHRLWQPHLRPRLSHLGVRRRHRDQSQADGPPRPHRRL